MLEKYLENFWIHKKFLKNLRNILMILLVLIKILSGNCRLPNASLQSWSGQNPSGGAALKSGTFAPLLTMALPASIQVRLETTTQIQLQSPSGSDSKAPISRTDAVYHFSGSNDALRGLYANLEWRFASCCALFTSSSAESGNSCRKCNLWL